MKKFSLLVLLMVVSIALKAQQDFQYFYNQDVTFDSSIPTPEQVLGFDVGEWHVSHDKLVEYMKAVAAATDKVKLEVTGYTYEHRPLLLLTITSAANHGQLPKIKKEHLSIIDSDINTQNMPVVVWLGHSIHGNEASGSNAALLMVY